MTRSPPISRRSALRLLAGSTPLIVAPCVLGADGTVAPSRRITMGFIGVGVHGHGYNLNNFLQHADAQVVAVCDVSASRRRKARETVDAKYGSKGCREYGDFRELLADPGIDAVCISTPDHWHVPIAMMALDAGKDVMCEKPTLTIAEGRALVEKVAEKQAVYQVGLEDRSTSHYHKLAQLVRNGAIGDLRRIIAGLPSGKAFPKEDPAPVPADLDYRMWLGPAPFHPYTPHRTHHEYWRQIRDYSGGMLTDWGAHLLDTAQVANFAEGAGPVSVEGKGTYAQNSLATMPIEFEVTYRYANGVELLARSGGVMLRFEGDKGWIGNDGWLGGLKASDPELLRLKAPPEQDKIWPRPAGEHRNFLDCVASRAPTTYTAEAGQRLSTLLHLGNISIELGRKLAWDPATESFPGDDAADALCTRVSREDWKA